MKRYSVFYMDELVAEVLDYGKGFEELVRSSNVEVVEREEELPEVPQSPPKHAVWLDA